MGDGLGRAQDIQCKRNPWVEAIDRISYIYWELKSRIRPQKHKIKQKEKKSHQAAFKGPTSNARLSLHLGRLTVSGNNIST